MEMEITPTSLSLFRRDLGLLHLKTRQEYSPQGL